MLAKLFAFLIFSKGLLCGCNKGDFGNEDQFKIVKVGHLHDSINESSGLVRATDSTFYTINDGWKREVFEIDRYGNLVNKFWIRTTGIGKKDWECLARTDSLLFIGDIGNNANHRRDLTIYTLPLPQLDTLSSFTYIYDDQYDFPPAKGRRNFDGESLIYHKGVFYVISKNRGKGEATLYRIDQKDTISNFDGTRAMYHDSYHFNGMVTGADISPDGTKLVVLTYGYVYLFDIQYDMSLSSPLSCSPFKNSGQAEGICFMNNTDILITNEEGTVFEGRPAPKKKKK